MTDTTAPEPLKINFELSDCFRCSGTGMYGPKSVKGGVCFHCNGEGKVITRNGSRALETFRALMAERMGTPAEEITEGSRVFTPADRVTTNAQIVAYPWKWRTVRTADVRTSETTNTETGETTVLRTIHLSFRNMPEDATHSKSVHEGEPLVIITPDREAHREIMREVAKRYKGAWLSTEEPPAPAAPRLRKTADVEKPKERPASEGRVRFIRILVAELPGGNEVRAEAEEALAGKLDDVTASALIDRLKKAKEDARPLPENRFGGKCRKCSAWVEEKKGNRVQVEGRWQVQHLPGECVEASAKTEGATAEERPPVTEEGLYRHDGRLYRVVEGRESGRLYAKEIVRQEDSDKIKFVVARGAIFKLSPADRVGIEEAEKISQQWDVCIMCGAELTASRGIGPVCRKKV